MVLRCDESAKQINELHGVHGPGSCRIENALPDAAFHCQATFAIDLQIFRLKTVRDFHFGILRNILARPDMEKESNMNRKDTGDISGCRFDLSWLFWHSFRTENGFAEKVLIWILDVILCFHMFPIVCIRLLRYKKRGCMGLHYLFMVLYEMRAVHPLFLPLDVNGLFSCVLPKVKHWQQLPCNFDANYIIYLI